MWLWWGGEGGLDVASVAKSWRQPTQRLPQSKREEQQHGSLCIGRVWGG